MKRVTAIFLKAAIAAAGLGVLAFLLLEPHLEGRNARATLCEIYFKDPFLAYVYLGSMPFFAALYQAYRVAGYAGRCAALPREAAGPLRNIKRCAVFTIGLVAAGEIWLVLAPSDDRAGGVFMGALVCAVCLAIAAAAGRYERIARAGPSLDGERERGRPGG